MQRVQEVLCYQRVDESGNEGPKSHIFRHMVEAQHVTFSFPYNNIQNQNP